MPAATLGAPGVSCVCSDVPRLKSDRVRVENALANRSEVTVNGANDVRTVFGETTGTTTRDAHPRTQTNCS
jgi:hypothetical protein